MFSVKKNKKFEEDMGMINENKRGYTSVKVNLILFHLFFFFIFLFQLKNFFYLFKKVVRSLKNN